MSKQFRTTEETANLICLFLSVPLSPGPFSLAGRRIGHPYQNRTPPKRKKPRTSFSRIQGRKEGRTRAGLEGGQIKLALLGRVPKKILRARNNLFDQLKLNSRPFMGHNQALHPFNSTFCTSPFLLFYNKLAFSGTLFWLLTRAKGFFYEHNSEVFVGSIQKNINSLRTRTRSLFFALKSCVGSMQTVYTALQSSEQNLVSHYGYRNTFLLPSSSATEQIYLVCVLGPAVSC